MKRFFISLFISITLIPYLSAKEGMWLPILLQLLNEKDMQEMGMKITAEDIYSVNNASLKDAIMIFGGGCTAEVVSDKGLLFTNYHCGYGNIQAHSAIDHDYLTDGFWAKNMTEELYCPGLTVRFLIRMEDVTEAVLSGVTDNMTQAERNKIIKENSAKISNEAIKGTHYQADIDEFFYGNNYYMFIYELFKDVRLVGAPPSNIGKFGGDTDNWMWPRHTGDFAVFRIYADADNKPASYSEDNKPFRPRKFLNISLKGYEKDDFTFVFGYPGRTTEYLPASAIKMVTEVKDPIAISVRDLRLNVMNAYSETDPLIRIQYASKIAGVANGWKKWKGEVQGIKRFKGVQMKTAYEAKFKKWCEENNKSDYSLILPYLNQCYSELRPYQSAFMYLIEAGLGMEIVNFAGDFSSLVKASKDKDTNKETLSAIVEKLKAVTESFFKDYHKPIDEELCPQLLEIYYNNVSAELRPDFFQTIEKKYNGDFEAFTSHMFKNSIFSNKEDVMKLLDNYKAAHRRKIEKDEAYKVFESLISFYRNEIYPKTNTINSSIDSTMRHYIKAQMEFDKDKTFYPDANFTLRVTYGKVDGFKAADAVTYNYFTTLDGVMEKENPDIYDYVIEPKLKTLYNNKDYGRYADKDGTLHTCFIASNHTTGGNSGSPVLNADGNLIGLNFDRNWQGTMSDLIYDPDMCRNIIVDIRYCLFIIDKFAGAGYLLDEMVIIE